MIPWVGGVLDQHCRLESEVWQNHFVLSCQELLMEHPRLAGIHVNIEPMPSGNQVFLNLLRRLRRELPEGKILSIASYPPPTWLQPIPEVHWDEAYFREVAEPADQMAVMMYDTGIRLPKVYESLLAYWTVECVKWAENCTVLLGVPVYNDKGVGYHYPHVENLKTSLAGIHSGLLRFDSLPPNYEGVALYCEWEMDPEEWDYLRNNFLAIR